MVKEEEELSPEKISRRRYLKYVGAAAATAIGGALGGSTILDYIGIPNIPSPIDLYNAKQIADSMEIDYQKALDFAYKINPQKDDMRKILNFCSEMHKINPMDKELSYTTINLAEELFLDGQKISDENLQELVKYFGNSYNKIPENLVPTFWSPQERCYVASDFVKQLFLDGEGFTPDKKQFVGVMDNLSWYSYVHAIQAGAPKNPRGDIDYDGFDNLIEALANKNITNPLETPETDNSEIYFIYLGNAGAYYDTEVEAGLITYILAVRNGIREDHIKLFSCGFSDNPHGDSLERTSPYREHYFPEIKGHLLKDYPIKIPYVDDEATKNNLFNEINHVLEVADENDVFMLMSNTGEFRLSNDERVYANELNQLLSKGVCKKIVYNGDCQAPIFFRALFKGDESLPLKDTLGISESNYEEQSSTGEFYFILLKNLKDGYSLKKAIPLEYCQPFWVSEDPYWISRGYPKPENFVHPVIYFGEGDYSWIDYYNPFLR